MPQVSIITRVSFIDCQNLPRVSFITRVSFNREARVRFFEVFKSSFWVLDSFLALKSSYCPLKSIFFSSLNQNLSILSENLEVLSQHDHQILQNVLKNQVFGKFQIEFLAFLVNRVFAKMLKKNPCKAIPDLGSF